MEMDLRDFGLWIEEAQRKVLGRRAEAYNASLLPHQKRDAINKAMQDLRWQIHELEWGDTVKDAESEYAERVRKGLHKPGRKKR